MVRLTVNYTQLLYHSASSYQRSEKFKKENKQSNNKIRSLKATMHSECLCDSSSEYSEGKIKEAGEEYIQCNRIFLNFTREFRNPAKDCFNIAKVKDLFKYLSEREDLQEMKVSGWLEKEEQDETTGEEEEEEEEQYEKKDEFESYYEDKTSPRGGGQRFAMSRDFWYRKLNTLKAQKLDEVALEAKDIPSDEHQADTKCMKWIQTKKVFSSQCPEKKKDILEEINLFDKSVAKPVEKELGKRFVNVYDNRKYFTKECN